eukprot:5361589-Lingulodinium_polyedra.AAC.1
MDGCGRPVCCARGPLAPRARPGPRGQEIHGNPIVADALKLTKLGTRAWVAEHCDAWLRNGIPGPTTRRTTFNIAKRRRRAGDGILQCVIDADGR